MLLEQFQLDEQKALEERQQRALKQREHIAATHKLLLDRRERLEIEFNQAKEELARGAERMREKQQIIEGERSRLLHDHVPDLVGYLPRVGHT